MHKRQGRKVQDDSESAVESWPTEDDDVKIDKVLVVRAMLQKNTRVRAARPSFFCLPV